MAEEFVSVVLPVYNREKTIKRAIDSVLAQTYASLELLVVDDGSTDSTLEIVQSYTDERLKLVCQEHGGANRARNTGVANAKGTHIAFQDSDDEWIPNKLEMQLAFMKTKGYLACFSPYYLHEKDKVLIIPQDYQDKERYQGRLADMLKSHNVVGTPTLILAKEAISLLHGEVFDETLPRLQEYEMLIRLVQLTDIGYMEIPLVNAHRDADNISNKGLHLYEAAGRILKKHGAFLDVRSFLDFYLVKTAEYEEISRLLEGIAVMQDIAGTCAGDLKAEVITYLHSRLTHQNTVLKKLFLAETGSLRRRKFVIYGTGAVAMDFYKKVCGQGIRPGGFIVTDIDGAVPETVDGNLVSAAEDYALRDILVVVCVSSRYQQDILNNLIRLGYSDICIYTNS